MSRTQNSKKNVFCPEKNILDLSKRMFFYLHAKYISNLIGFKEKKVLRLFDTLGYIFMFETHNSEKKQVFCSKNVIFDFFQTFFSKRLNCIMRSMKKNVAQFVQKVGEGLLTHGFSSRGLRGFFYGGKMKSLK